MKLLSHITHKRWRESNLKQPRKIEIKGFGHNPKGKRFPNKVSTTKYTWYSFLPKGLYEQFRRVANLYFAFHAAITLTPVTPVNPITTILPLAFVIGMAIVKEGIEDIRRGRADKDVNNRFVRALDRNGCFKKCRWKELNVGNIVKVECDEFFPADLLFLFSSSGGSCYVETANLDGETNLKIKRCPDDTAQLSENALKDFNAYVECEQPNPSIYSFEGSLIWKDKTSHLGPGQILLRGSKLRKTPIVYGVVLFAGYETKIMMNTIDPPSKRSFVEHQLDYIILFQLLLLLCMSAASATVFAVWLGLDGNKHWYLQPGINNGKNSIASAAFNYRNPFIAGVLQFFTCLVLYGYFVPISLYVSLEIVKIIQALFINSDLELYYEKMDKPASARTSNLNEELGQVSTILSDKTGTLTCNEMEFFKCSIAGISYGTGTTEVEQAAAVRAGKASSCSQEEQASNVDAKLEKGFSLRDARLDNLNWKNEPTRDMIFRFLEILAVCNTVVIEGPADPDAIHYIAESPDEASFVVAAKRLGVFLFDRSETSISLKVFDKDGSATICNYQLLNTIEFSSVRKRMSVIVRDSEDHLLLFCKGADEVMFDRLADDGNNFLRITTQHMNDYAEAGLRTLAIAYRVLDESMYAQWQDHWMAAKQEILTGDSPMKKLNELADEIECNLTLVGATAIEDKLQVGVPQAIYRLAEAGIKIWVLTGDKMETAINIGYACSLLRSHMTKHIVRLEDHISISPQAAKQDTESELCKHFVSHQIEEGVRALDDKQGGNMSSHAIIIDGKSLDFVLQDEPLKQKFMRFALRCDSVICCRTSPIQKAIVTELVRNHGRQICLAIGDGANDVGMIQKANIGVGISGIEGQQAAMSADFSIAQFRFLEKLLLVHGAWCYRRTTFMIKYFFYKNFVFGFSIFLFNAYTRFSGQSIYADWFLSLYNVIFTCAPVVVIAVLDQDLKANSRLNFPQLYKKGQLNGSLLLKRIISWMMNGVLQAAVCFFSVVYGYGYGKVPDRNGQTMGLFTMGTTMYTCVLFVVSIQIAVVIQYWTWLHHLFIWGELLVWFAFLLVFGELPVKLSGELHRLFIMFVSTSLNFYRITLLTTVLALVPSFTLHCFSRNFNPLDNEIVQEKEKRSGGRSASTGGQSEHELKLMPAHYEGFTDVSNCTNKAVSILGSRQWADSFEAQAQPLRSVNSELHLSQMQKSVCKSGKELEMEITDVGCYGISEPNSSVLARRTDLDLQRSSNK